MYVIFLHASAATTAYAHIHTLHRSAAVSPSFSTFGFSRTVTHQHEMPTTALAHAHRFVIGVFAPMKEMLGNIL